MAQPASSEKNAAPSSAGGSEPARLLLRFSGDITTKARATRKRFLQRMARNLKDALSEEAQGARLIRTQNRFLVAFENDNRRAQGRRGDAYPDHTDGPDAAFEALSHVFGVQSLSRVEERPWQTLDELVAAGVEIFGPRLRGRRFAVRARRVGDRSRIGVQSGDLDRALGSALLADGAGPVDLGTPEQTAHVEIMPGHAYFFAESLTAQGGLPLGCEGRAVALVSGGFDSPVAAWQMMRRGVALDYVFCMLGGRTHQLETLRVMKVIADRWAYGTRPRFFAIDFDEVTREIQARVATRYWQIVLKRQMLRCAQAVAEQTGALAIVTGEAVGQVSSQTLQNLAVISAATTLPILRPLVGQNKQEIIALSRRVGTHDLSRQVAEYCAIVPSHPATRAARAAIEAEERALDPDVLARAIAERAVYDLRSLDPDTFDRPEIRVDFVAPAATLIDLRSRDAFERWHYPGALFLDFRRALELYPQFDPAQRYVLYCEYGLKSAQLADRMRGQGLRASHFAGGLKALRAYALARDESQAEAEAPEKAVDSTPAPSAAETAPTRSPRKP